MNLTVKDIAALEEVSERQIQRYVSEGFQGHKLPAQRTGKRLTIDSEAYRQWRVLCGWETVQPEVLDSKSTHVSEVPVPEPSITQDEPVPPAYPPYPHPANPRGCPTNVPHENSSTMPHPEACRIYLESEARKLVEKLRGNPDA